MPVRGVSWVFGRLGSLCLSALEGGSESHWGTACNAKKQRKDWRDFIIERAGPNPAERHARVRAFLDEYRYNEYRYKPTFQLREVAEELYEEVGSIAMTLITVKIKRIRRCA